MILLGWLDHDRRLLKENPNPSVEEIEGAQGTYRCRCSTYLRICAGTHRAAEVASKKGGKTLARRFQNR